MLAKSMQFVSRSSLHTNYINLRRLANGHSVQSFSTASAGAASEEQKVLFDELSPSVTEFKLNAPKNLNSLDFDMVHLMLRKVSQWNKAPQQASRVLLMSGVGGKAFCAGGDIKLIYDSGTGKADSSIKSAFFHDEYVLDY